MTDKTLEQLIEAEFPCDSQRTSVVICSRGCPCRHRDMALRVAEAAYARGRADGLEEGEGWKDWAVKFAALSQAHMAGAEASREGHALILQAKNIHAEFKRALAAKPADTRARKKSLREEMEVPIDAGNRLREHKRSAAKPADTGDQK